MKSWQERWALFGRSGGLGLAALGGACKGGCLFGGSGAVVGALGSFGLGGLAAALPASRWLILGAAGLLASFVMARRIREGRARLRSLRGARPS